MYNKVSVGKEGKRWKKGHERRGKSGERVKERSDGGNRLKTKREIGIGKERKRKGMKRE